MQTFAGHSVTRTLIRCCFSPERTTGGRCVLKVLEALRHAHAVPHRGRLSLAVLLCPVSSQYPVGSGVAARCLGVTLQTLRVPLSCHCSTGVTPMPRRQIHTALQASIVFATLVTSPTGPSPCVDRFVCTGSSDGDIWIYDIVTGEVEQTLSFHRGPVRDVAWHPDDPLLASSSWDGRLGLWNYHEE
jgi:hypothetical protein